jgi:GntR family transcriptional regulator
MLTHVPLYLQIQQFVRDGIRSGRFVEGRRLPSETELAARFRTTRATVAHAFHQLAFEGLVTRRVGSGTYVGRGEAQDRVDTSAFESHEEHVLASGEALTYRVLRFAPEPARTDAAAHLDLAAGASVYRLERLRLVNGRPLAFELRFIPRGIGGGIRRESLAASTIQDILQNQLGLRIGTIDNAVRASAATARIAASLGMPKSMPVLVRAHTIRDTGARPLLFGETYYPAHFSIRYTLHAP